ncbi:Glucose-1-phosphate adenylyltransferase [Thermogutta terrifontis]|jgi:glucose-1-phosphate adenylyltransferase|uniref:Glucose-1-phosphate adenylyltransferase n=1 Tax=Thermogutta terrifontis TaxID=1331910 RepID=A0A286RAJ0_9BACT|nr:glucose-1-phosphate adenylyltransferase [Thermogutta terrifontis]ASV72984.1 Glucose-1-phosphate adenylyltransferase [Thermogutta terrifontis]
MNNVLAVVLGGGRGTRLYPLTKYRSKPAVPIAGKYRLIDIPLSNCINSGISRIYVLTQFNSVSLHRHIRATYNFDVFHRGFVEILAAQQTLTRTDWYQGTADAVRQNLSYIDRDDIDYVLILSGDQLYRMDFRKLLETHQRSEADVTIAALPVTAEAASSLGIMRIDETGRVLGFLEKPKTEEELSFMRTDPEWFAQFGLKAHGRPFLANMGIYLFNRKTLVDVLEKTDYRDFGKEVFPASVRARRVFVHLFDGYWEDIGTIGAFFEANLALTRPSPPFALDQPNAPIYTRARFLPPSRIERANIRDSLVADGCVIGEGAVIENSIIGLRSIIGPNCVIRNSIIMGNDFYEAPTADRQALMIDENSYIENAIVDKNCRIGKNVRIVNAEGVKDAPETEYCMIRDGVTVIPKGTVLPDNWAL